MCPQIETIDPFSKPRVLLEDLREALEGHKALLPVNPDEHALLAAADLDRPTHDDTALLLPTSGSTGTPKVVELSASALLASAHATHTRIGPPGRWLLPLPLTHIAGWQVLVRSLLAGRDPVQLQGSFTPDAFFANATGVSYCSLVPTQLVRLLADPRPAPDGLTILLGGAAADPTLLETARERGYRVVTTYGSSETAGGCVYDGLPLDGVRVTLNGDGRLRLGGPTIATGYRQTLPENPFHEADGTRWFTTSDLAELDAGRLRIIGRADDVIVTGGEKVHPVSVEQALLQVEGITGAIVVGLPHPEWGQRVTALVTGAAPSLPRLRDSLDLPNYAMPRKLLVVNELPLLGIGKPDRARARELAQESVTSADGDPGRK